MSEIPDLTLRQAADAMKAIKPSPHAPTNRKNLARAAAPIIAAKAREQVLADALTRIEGLKQPPLTRRDGGWNSAIDAALAALNQPQTEKGCPACFGPFDGVVCRCPDGGGAATPRGVADALTLTPGEARNLVDAAMGDEHYPQLLDSTVKRIGDEADRQLAEPTPYAKAFRERVCPVPEFPSVGTAPQEAQADPKQNWCWCEHGTCEVCAPVPQTEGEDK